MNKKLNIVRVGDQDGWAYSNISKEHAKYSRHNIIYQKHDEVDLKNIDLIYIHSPDISDIAAVELPLKAKELNIPVIGNYGGNPNYWLHNCTPIYKHADIISTISPQTYKYAKENYKDIPVIFLPESIDCRFFTEKKFDKAFRVGWAGGAHKKIKRTHILDKLDYPVIIQSEWGHKLFTKDRTLDHMVKFYHSIGVLLVTSETECMPRVVLEAMSCCLPIISTDVGSIPMLLDKEWIVPVNPEEEVIKQMNEKLYLLKKYPALRKAVGKRNLNHIKKYFSWKANVKLWDDVFEYVYNRQNKKAIRLADNFIKPYKKYFYIKLPIFDFAGVSKTIPLLLENRIEEKGDILEEGIKQANEGKVTRVRDLKGFLETVEKESFLSSNFNELNSEEKIKELLTKLSRRYIVYLQNFSCLDCVRFEALKLNPNHLELGIFKLKEQDEILELLKDKFKVINNIAQNGNLKVTIGMNGNVFKTKEMILYGMAVNVPFPVITYLVSLFGINWDKYGLKR